MRRVLVVVTMAWLGICLSGRLYAQGCDDGNKCTTGDSCIDGRCTGIPKQCPKSTDPCMENFCNPTTGGCDSRPVVCNDGNPCTTDKCVAGVGCTFTNNDSNTCSDANDCTSGDHCSAGKCVGTVVTNGTACGPTAECQGSCTGGVCDLHVNDGNMCFMGHDCSRTCSGGACSNDSCAASAAPCAPAFCTDVGCIPIDKCPAALFTCFTTGSCDTSTGTCLNTPRNEGGTCDDQNVCTANDRCEQGTCRGDPLGTHLVPALSPHWQVMATGALAVLGIYLLRRSRRGTR